MPCMHVIWKSLTIADAVHTIALETIFANTFKAAWFINAFRIRVTVVVLSLTLIDVCIINPL